MYSHILRIYYAYIRRANSPKACWILCYRSQFCVFLCCKLQLVAKGGPRASSDLMPVSGAPSILG